MKEDSLDQKRKRVSEYLNTPSGITLLEYLEIIYDDHSFLAENTQDIYRYLGRRDVYRDLKLLKKGGI